jgi:hypothetical protein
MRDNDERASGEHGARQPAVPQAKPDRPARIGAAKSIWPRTRDMPEVRERNRPGRPAFRPTDEQHRQVEAMVGYGIPEGQICRLITNPQTKRPIDEKTLRRHFRSEIDTGQVKANAAVAQSLFKMATGGNVTAAIFWMKTQMGWKETAAVEMSGTMTLEALVMKSLELRKARGAESKVIEHQEG